MYCFTRKTLVVGTNRDKIHLLRVKTIVLRVNQKYYYILMYCFLVKSMVLRVKSIVSRVKTSVLSVKHWINDPFDHKLQITLINVTMF